jgi:drug/metabolite transporter (DMT)-like permease
MMAPTVFLALLAAMCFAVASVLQHDGARQARRRAMLHPGLLAELAGKRVWLAGVAVQGCGVMLHLVAVNLGPLSVVQPVLTIGLVFALLLQRVRGRPIGRPALLAAGLVVLGLALFLVVSPTGAAPIPAAARAWLPGLVLVGVVLAVVLGAGLSARGSLRCVCLGAAAGVLMATSAALGKAWGGVLGAEGLPGLLSSWALWAALACGAGGALLSQAAFQSGPLGGSLGAMMATDPLVGVALGVLVFGEPFANGASVLARSIGLVLTLAGVALLARMQRSGHPAQERQLSQV